MFVLFQCNKLEEHYEKLTELSSVAIYQHAYLNQTLNLISKSTDRMR